MFLGEIFLFEFTAPQHDTMIMNVFTQDAPHLPFERHSNYTFDMTGHFYI